ncbi:reverse transcriptase domain-containing protein [Tanacetum coccineum]
MRTRSSLEYTILRRRNRRRSLQQQEAIPLIPEPEFPMADDRPMAEQLQAPTGGTTNLRNEITNFRQIAQESFSEAWERFKELLRKCPHHGFSLMHQLDTFYNSLSYNDQDSLNSAAGGNFLYKSPTEGLQIIENKAKVRCSRNAVMRVSTNAPPSSSTSSSSNFEFQQAAAVGGFVQGNSGYPPYSVASYTRPPGFTQPNPLASRPNQGYNRNQGYNGTRNVFPMTKGGYNVPDLFKNNFQHFQQTLRSVNLSKWEIPDTDLPTSNQIRPPGYNQL